MKGNRRDDISARGTHSATNEALANTRVVGEESGKGEGGGEEQGMDEG